MRATTLLSALLAATVAAAAEARLAKIYIEPVSLAASKAPVPLAEVEYDVKNPTEATVASFELPELPEDGAKLVRVGVYDPAAAQWTSSVSVASTENFAKGYQPNILLNVDADGNVVGAGLKGVRVDAGVTRDFGPQAVVTVTRQGKTPELNKPIVLSPEGKKVVQEEKTLFQKYVALPRCGYVLILTAMQILVGDCDSRAHDGHGRRGRKVEDGCIEEYPTVESPWLSWTNEHIQRIALQTA